MDLPKLFDRLPPVALEAEMALIGSMLIAGSHGTASRQTIFESIRQHLNGTAETAFSRPSHSVIFKTILELHEAGSLDNVQLIQRLREKGQLENIGGADYLIRLAESVPTAENAPYYARIVVETAKKRCIIEEAGDLLRRTYEAGPNVSAEELAEYTTRKLMEIASNQTDEVATYSSLEEKEMKWLWPGRFPLGAVCMIVGDPDVGKTTFLCDIMARVSTGCAWPDQPETLYEPSGCLFIGEEDDNARTIKPRLRAAGADMERVSYVYPDKMDTWDIPTGMLKLAGWIKSIPECRLICIDPIMGFMGDIDCNYAPAVRAALRPLKRLAEENQLTVIMLNHNRKGEGSAMDRSGQSKAFIGAARAAYLFQKDKDDVSKTRKLFLPIKGNLTPDARGMSYRIVGGLLKSDPPCIAWDADPVDISADEASGHTGPRKATRECINFISDALGDGPVTTRDFNAAAKAHGYTENQLRRARDVMKNPSVKPIRMGKIWGWELVNELPSTSYQPAPRD